MSAIFWQRIHGGSTHFPIVLLLASVVFDFIAWRTREEALRRGFHVAGFGSALVGMLGGFGAVIAGLFLTHGRMLGGGYEKMHHLFVWPAIITCGWLVGWRLLQRGRIASRAVGAYLAGMGVVAVLMVGAGYSGGEMLLSVASGEGAVSSSPAGTGIVETGSVKGESQDVSASNQSILIATGRQLFLKNCAHCHGADARGDEGPDLHKLDLTNEQIAARIRNGKKGQMTAFAGKFSPEDIKNVLAYLRTLND